MLITDIETGPLDHAELLAANPFVPTDAPGEFNPVSVKYGNAKNESLRAKILGEAQAKHAAAVAAYAGELDRLKAEHEQQVIETAPLSPDTGCVLAIGYYAPANQKLVLVHGGDEATMIQEFWNKACDLRRSNRRLVGHNLMGFDLPFLIRRSWRLGLDVPNWVRDGRYWAKQFACTREAWLLGQPWKDVKSSLDHVARMLGVGAKTPGVDGGQFWKLYANPETRQQALDYLENDLILTAAVAARIGVC